MMERIEWNVSDASVYMDDVRRILDRIFGKAENVPRDRRPREESDEGETVPKTPPIKEIPDIVSGAVGEPINCYPGIPGRNCYRIAVFLSLVKIFGSSKAQMRHLYFEEALQKFVQHMQGACPGTTEVAIFITDSWDHAVYRKWRSNVEVIRRNGDLVEFFLVDERRNITYVPF
jgi:hypothetical protein